MQPLPKSSEFLSEIQTLLNTHSEVDEFTIRRLTREAKKLINVNPVSAYVALGTLAVLQLDVKKVHYYFNQAINIQENITVWNNYCVCLGTLGYTIEAGELLKKLSFKQNISDLKFLFNGVNLCSEAGLFFTSFNFLLKYNKLSPKKTHALTESIISTISFMEKLNLKEEMLTPLFDVHSQILRKYDVIERLSPMKNFKQINYYYSKEYNDFCYEIYIDKPVEEICEMADELADAVAELDLPADVVYHFTPLYRVYAG